jgi:Protein of unknown function (DUF3348)
VRDSLARTVAVDSVFATTRRRAHGQTQMQGAPMDAPADYAVFRQRYVAIQQSMETGIATLRGRLRGMLAAKAPAMARLAMIDAVMERALSERERNLLASVPGLLAGHFERLREAEQQSLAAAQTAEASEDAAPITPGAWLDVFRKDMQSVLLAELEVRFQPVEGLLAALRTR